MALPIWALYMKANYADEELNVSRDDFQKPEDLSINLDCTNLTEEQGQTIDYEDDLDDLDF
jgi:penicillin-binding protein 1A